MSRGQSAVSADGTQRAFVQDDTLTQRFRTTEGEPAIAALAVDDAPLRHALGLHRQIDAGGDFRPRDSVRAKFSGTWAHCPSPLASKKTNRIHKIRLFGGVGQKSFASVISVDNESRRRHMYTNHGVQIARYDQVSARSPSASISG
ncbi:hypothetical protein C1D09_030070 [Mesorhizobium intechi]|uniref:Uncharacterized protein n=1 Tax=Mesorhizobium intechi TaxID=537601 RepID=A0A8T9AHR3_9HYPH|nr:hypothetical protein [Mesorhizobium intechi]TSE02393.1 hypothetical protein C1D09_030070 [Mesorhizobium intechi]